jgi:hypothetical protein
MTKLKVAAALVLLAGTATATLAVAGGPGPNGPSFSIRPVTDRPDRAATRSYFIFTTGAGSTIESDVRVTNVGDAAGLVLLYPVDATTGQTSGTVYRPRAAPRRGVGAWLRLPLGRLRLDPGESKIIPLQLVVPSRADSGQHVGGLVAESVSHTTQAAAGGRPGSSSFRINLRFLTIVAVQLNVPGRRLERMEVADVKADRIPGYQRLQIGLYNAGNVMLKPIIELRVTSPGGRSVLTRKIRLDSFLPKTAIHYPLYLRERGIRPGRYRASITLGYGHGRQARYQTWFRISS